MTNFYLIKIRLIIKKHNLLVKASKFLFGFKELKICCNGFYRSRFNSIPRKIQSVGKKLESFLDAVNYSSDFVRNQSTNVKPWHTSQGTRLIMTNIGKGYGLQKQYQLLIRWNWKFDILQSQMMLCLVFSETLWLTLSTNIRILEFYQVCPTSSILESGIKCWATLTVGHFGVERILKRF